MKAIETHELGKMHENGALGLRELSLSVALFGAALLAVDYLLVARVGPRFERERIISSLQRRTT